MIASVLLTLLIGLSVALADLFALAANRLRWRQIISLLLLDALIISLAFSVTRIYELALLFSLTDRMIRPGELFAASLQVRLPLLQFFTSATPYIGDVIAFGLLCWQHAGFLRYLTHDLAFDPVISVLITTPFFLLTLLLLDLLLRRRWRRIYQDVVRSAGADWPLVRLR